MSKPQITRRTQAERTRASKEKIIQAASEFFAQQGYRGAKMADIAKAANLTEPGLLHHFPSKTHLLMAVLAERDRVDRERFNPSLLGEKGDLLSSFQKLVEYNETVPGLVQLFTVLVAESVQEQHPAHVFFMRRYQNEREQDIEVVRQGQAQGEIRADIPAEDLTIMLYAMMDGLQVQWLFEPETIDMARIFGQFVRLLKGAEK
jgi:AcrR family transcriptional regulator